ncbi:hypothetical protein HanRHA438_Chr02g0049191 [Helianthus annuus]|uniref:Uncharacterized protein n=1 Tax=Helianthus annuus TaxID=4232 RepID=A0A9K3JKM9_HELAN|nr:hypothetical protein HanXRQr2_Chr02g0048061 [Helianthus annuus]KAJ0603532.1 hypothetical protein HanHA300_Chr02g0039351 [Helianthus annuus]KAJ0613635.1 hypothetical protein HanIR_Chr02g0053641 [Helianthus annuus]KAJ0617447.1 hypothetical protein HanHA89_Chr02g0042011 [Helianthus annuus]KAJ0775988.1 hypothetical protein HanLR1_Chr02g0040571 [Helianthus annuus]
MATPVATVAPPAGLTTMMIFSDLSRWVLMILFFVCFFPEIAEIRSHLLTWKELLWFLLRLLKAPQQVLCVLLLNQELVWHWIE